jgi:single-strand DNA-binding protein
MNSVVLSGRLTRDPELRQTGSGTSVCSFTLAVDRAGDRKQDESGYESGFFDCNVFGNQAELAAQYLTRGSRAAVKGELKHHKWQNEAGDNRSKVEVTAFHVEFLDTRADREAREQGNQYVPAGGQTTTDADFAGTDDDIPF